MVARSPLELQQGERLGGRGQPAQKQVDRFLGPEDEPEEPLHVVVSDDVEEQVLRDLEALVDLRGRPPLANRASTRNLPQAFEAWPDAMPMARKGRKISRKWDYAKFAYPHCGKTAHVSIAARRPPGTAEN